MTDFAVLPLSEPAGCFNGFPSTAQHVTRNRHGTFYAVMTSVGNVTAGTPNAFAVLRDSGSGPATLWAHPSLPTNMVCLESFSTGELYAIWCDFAAGVINIAYWADVDANPAPVFTQLFGAGCNSGKIGVVIDEGRRCLYVVGIPGYAYRISDAGVEIGRQRIWQVVSDAPAYVHPMMDETGNLYVLICSAMLVGGAVDYDAVTAIMTPDPADIGGAGAAWFAGVWPGPQLSLPFDPGQAGAAAAMLTGEQSRTSNNLLIGGAVRQGRLHAAVMQTTRQAEPGFDLDDLRHISVEALATDWGSPPWSANGTIHRPLRAGGAFPRCASGGYAVRSSGTFLVLHDRDSLLAFRSTDAGRSWSLYAKTQFPGLGSDMLHYVALARGDYDDTDVIGMLTVEHCTPSQWATSTCPVPPAFGPRVPQASAHAWSLDLSACH